MLSKEQIAQYHEQGYLKVEELFSPSESEELAAEMVRVIEGELARSLEGHYPVGYAAMAAVVLCCLAHAACRCLLRCLCGRGAECHDKRPRPPEVRLQRHKPLHANGRPCAWGRRPEPRTVHRA